MMGLEDRIGTSHPNQKRESATVRVKCPFIRFLRLGCYCERVRNRVRNRPISISKVTFWLFAESLFRRLNRMQIAIERLIVAAVQIEQEDLDNVAGKLEELVTVLNGVDLTPLPEADQT